ncbi:MAG: hypothetical protein IKW71_00300, partial [Elusimicrobiaceae bacterium]|nr:hypothetical protein [Elusimicrobiaceae bacterium]
MHKQGWLFLTVGCVLLAGLGALGVHGFDMKGIVKSLTQETKHFQSGKESNSTIISQEEQYRGRAQQMRPDISVPPSPTAPAVQEPPAGQIGQLITGLEQIADSSNEQVEDSIPVEAYRPVNSAQKVRWLPPPPGFLTGDTFNYLIYREKDPVTPKVKDVLDNIHGNLMLDLTPFTVVVKPSKILVMLFDQKQSYMDYTKRPAWSGASSDLQADTMYIIEKTGFYSL